MNSEEECMQIVNFVYLSPCLLSSAGVVATSAEAAQHTQILNQPTTFIINEASTIYH
jgi:hypothetical protein